MIIMEESLKMLYYDRIQWIRENTTMPALHIGCADEPIFKPYGLYPQVHRCDLDLYDLPNFTQCDAHNLPYEDKSFSTAVLAEVLEHVKDPVRVLNEAKRVARDRVVITVPIESMWGPVVKPFSNVEESVIKEHGSYEKWVEHMKHTYPVLKAKFPDSVEPHSFHVRYFTPESFRELIGNKAEIKLLKNQEFVWMVTVLNIQ